MWRSHIENLSKPVGQKIKFSGDGKCLRYADIIANWRNNSDFRHFFNEVVAKAPFEALRWETRPVTAANINADFECVLLDCPGLISTPDPSSFAVHFTSDNVRDNVVAFANLGSDATLIVPVPPKIDASYGHLASFARTAPESQTQSLWRTVGEEMQNRVGEQPVWLSTAGMGVAWLHVRLDDRPKYYGYSPYRDRHWQTQHCS
jgi:hypothetical protein